MRHILIRHGFQIAITLLSSLISTTGFAGLIVTPGDSLVPVGLGPGAQFQIPFVTRDLRMGIGRSCWKRKCISDIRPVGCDHHSIGAGTLIHRACVLRSLRLAVRHASSTASKLIQVCCESKFFISPIAGLWGLCVLF
jgi:hypothetical protein